MPLTLLQNFGANVRFEPHQLFTPADKNDVLALLEQFRGRNIRAVGSLHSWSEAAVGRDIVLNLRHLNQVTLQAGDDGSVYAEIEAGCTIERALDYLASHGGFTLPACAIIGKQTIAGAVATATHGSGRPSLSHYVSAVCAAAYDRETGRARMYTWDAGDALRAARCGLGCTGVVLWIRIRVERDCLLEERTRRFERIEQALEQEGAYPRQQFYLIPWSWLWCGQLRGALTNDRGDSPAYTARVQRLAKLALIDMALNGLVRFASATLQSQRATRWLFRRVVPLLAQPGLRIVDDSRHILMMRHDLFVHVEMELFVTAAHVVHAAAFVEWVLRCCGGESRLLPAMLAHDNFGRDVAAEIEPLRNRYVHDYPITFRRVLADDTLISMTSGSNEGAWYAISLITYQRDHGPFLEVARFLAAAMASAYRARPHWGKICPLTGEEIAALYPALPRFRAHCASVDPDQAFVNEFARRLLGF